MAADKPMNVATPKTQAKTFFPPPKNSWVATAGSVLAWPASSVRMFPLSLSVKLQGWMQRQGPIPGGPWVNMSSSPQPPPDRVRWHGVKRQPRKDLESAHTRRIFFFLFSRDNKEQKWTRGFRVHLIWKRSLPPLFPNPCVHEGCEYLSSVYSHTRSPLPSFHSLPALEHPYTEILLVF